MVESNKYYIKLELYCRPATRYPIVGLAHGVGFVPDIPTEKYTILKRGTRVSVVSDDSIAWTKEVRYGPPFYDKRVAVTIWRAQNIARRYNNRDILSG